MPRGLPGSKTARRPRLRSARCAAPGVPAFHGPLLPPSGPGAPCSAPRPFPAAEAASCRASRQGSGPAGSWREAPPSADAVTLQTRALRTHGKPVKRSRRAGVALSGASVYGCGASLDDLLPWEQYGISTRLQAVPKPVLCRECGARPCPQELRLGRESHTQR